MASTWMLSSPVLMTSSSGRLTSSSEAASPEPLELPEPPELPLPSAGPPAPSAPPEPSCPPPTCPSPTPLPTMPPAGVPTLAPTVDRILLAWVPKKKNTATDPSSTTSMTIKARPQGRPSPQSDSVSMASLPRRCRADAHTPRRRSGAVVREAPAAGFPAAPGPQGRYSTPFADGALAFFGSAVPMSGRNELSPRRRHSSARPSTRRTGRVGSAKIAVPTWTATAPTAR
jgi:hypothetical protein